MKAKESRLLEFLGSSKQFVTPIYQRPYRWEEPQCRKLWQDVLRAGRNPQLIFESLNSTGKELGQADLIRNYVLMGLPPNQQIQLYDGHWRPMEVAFERPDRRPDHQAQARQTPDVRQR